MNKKFLAFIKIYHNYLWWYLFVVGTFLVVAYLYQLLQGPIYYAIGIISFVVAVIVILKYVSFSMKYKQMSIIVSNVSEGDLELPRADSIFEDWYQEIIIILKEREKENISKMENGARARDDYYTMWVHQIKTPISAMDLLIQSAEHKLENGEEEITYNFLSMMRQELFKTEQYAEMVLQYLRIEQMGEDLSFKELSLKRIVHAVIKKYSLLFIHKKITPELKDLDPVVLTDEKWCTFLVEQIVSNAIKYSKENSTIEIYTTKQGNLIIEDKGIGIREDDLPRIFDRGFTGYNGRMYNKATGLGLYLCKQVVDKLSMNILIESKVSKGTRVILEFPTEKLELF